MNNKGNVKTFLIISLCIILVMFIPIILDYYRGANIISITYSELKEKISSKESFVLFIDEIEDEDKRNLKSLESKETESYSTSYSLYSINSDDIEDELFEDDTRVVYVIDGDIQKEDDEIDTTDISDSVDIYYIGNISEDNKSYKVASDFNSYKKLVKSNDVTMAVFGRDTCVHCNHFKVVYNAVAEKYDVDIYFFNSDDYDTKEYTKIINMDLTVPAECSSDGSEFKLSDGFGTPLTIFTKKGKVIDCISGYVDRETLLSKLTELKMISEV